MAEPRLSSVDTELHPRRTGFTLQARLRELLWTLSQRTPEICSRLLERLSPFDIGPDDLRIDKGDGTLGGLSLNFWALDYKARCDIRLQRIEVTCPTLHDVGLPRLDSLVQEVLAAVLEADPSAQFESYEVTIQMHAGLLGETPEMFLRRFTGRGLEGLGPGTGSAVCYYFGSSGPRTSCALTVDMSRMFDDAIYTDGRAVFDGAEIGKEELASECESFVQDCFGALGVALPATGEST